MRRPTILALLSACLLPLPALAWDGSGHRMITRVALEGLREDLPSWLRDEETIFAAADQSQTPDRWRSVRVEQLTHINNPDHYLDVEDLEHLGLTLRTLPPLRHEFVKQITLARAKPDFAGPPVDPAKDAAKTDEYPGFAAHAILENYGRLVGAFRMVRTLEASGTPQDQRRAAQVQAQVTAAKWNARIQIGMLSHFVGDVAQPLHTTRHHHGWVGDNPRGYTTDRGFHAYIDGTILRIHSLRDDDIRGATDFDRELDRRNAWSQVLDHVERSWKEVEPLYRMKKDGSLEQAPGKAFIIQRLADGAGMLSAMVEAAWIEAAPTPRDVQDLQRYEPPDAGAPASPAAAPGN